MCYPDYWLRGFCAKSYKIEKPTRNGLTFREKRLLNKMLRKYMV